ncbi:MAG: SpoVR family protein [Gammaproteobacteria bacterium]
MSKKEPISTGSEWTFELLEIYDREIGRIANDYGLDTYPNQIEIISAEQMMDAYASVGMPIGYNHWSFGKQFVTIEKNYKRGHMGLAYEIIINSNPSIAYLMEENSITMQALVIAHACYGHNSFFKNNYLFRSWTNADSIVDYLVFAKNYISQCEERHGIEAVEETLDACHALMNQGVDRYKRSPQPTLRMEKIRQIQRQEYMQSQVNDLWRTIPVSEKNQKKHKQPRFPAEPEENILYFLEKNAPLLKSWQREIIRIVRKIAQYFYPQRQTQVMNEGWACFWHYTLLHNLYDEGLVSDEFMIEFLQSHTNVVYQPSFDSPYFSGINPYALGYNMMNEIKRICQHPTSEDKQWFPELAGSDWLKSIKFAMENFKDESFISQYLSPKLMRDMKFFAIFDDDEKDELVISAIHDEDGYRKIRQILSDQYNLSNIDPNIQIYNADINGNRSLTLRHYLHNNKPLSNDSEQVLKYLHSLWGFDIKLEVVDPSGKVHKTLDYPTPTQPETQANH